ncbi:MAG: serine/threonine-protein kinase, partial [Acidobacteria bacterium]
MSLSPGTRLGPYEIVAPLGAGGMGEVYRAKDTKLNRDVAIKVLPESFALDADRVARFTREAQVLASLNHPNIAAIYGIEESHVRGSTSGVRALVMELVDGEDLSAQIARGPMPLAEALPIATQMADALEAAHDQGIVHRDLKPQNVKLRGDGTVKVLDFGLAKAIDAAGTSSDALMNSPTMTARATQMGMVIGTAAYMSPEQAKGRAVDRRADIWAFGVVLMEMLTGRQVFGGDTVSEVMASVMKDEPDWSQLPATLPPSIGRLLRRCLDKDPRKRLSAIGDARFELTDTGHAPAASATTAPARPRRWPLALAAVGGAAAATIAFVLIAPALGPAPAREPSRVSVLGPSGVTLMFDSAESAISPDGRTLVFATADPNGSTRLWVRPLASTEARVLPGTEAGHLAFWSPDSRNIGFFTDDKLKRIAIDGGPVAVLCEAKDGRGGAWGANNVIVFAPANAGPLMQVAATGGTPAPATTLDAARGETSHRFPSFLPDGRHFVFASLPAKNQKFDLFLGALDGTRSGPIASSESAAVYADPGYLIFSSANVLVAQHVDVATAKLSGEPVTLGDAPGSQGGTYTSSPPLSASRTGTLAYLGDGFAPTSLRWLDRAGRNAGTLTVPEGRYQEIAMSPDGTRVAVTRFSSQNTADLWIADVARGGATRFTSAPGGNVEAVWSPDGKRIAFASDRGGPRDFFVKPASG